MTQPVCLVTLQKYKKNDLIGLPCNPDKRTKKKKIQLVCFVTLQMNKKNNPTGLPCNAAKKKKNKKKQKTGE